MKASRFSNCLALTFMGIGLFLLLPSVTDATQPISCNSQPCDCICAPYVGAAVPTCPSGPSGECLGTDDDDVICGNDYGVGDTIFAGKGNDIVCGFGGDDFLDGGCGGDYLDGGSGVDTLGGSFGADELHGGDDNDFLLGGWGEDAMFGDDGDDTLQGGRCDDPVHDGGSENLGDTCRGGRGFDDVFTECESEDPGNQNSDNAGKCASTFCGGQ